MTGPSGALLGGLAAGLAVAMPLGAIGVLLLHEGMTRGARSAAAGAAGVALVDTLYAALAVLGGSWIATTLGGHEAVVRLVGAAVLGAVAAAGLVRTLRPAGPSRPLPSDSGPTTGPLADLAAARGARPWAVFARFVALTAVNPLTAAAFVALAAGLAFRWSTPADGAAFVTGVAMASLAWQLALAGAGGLLGRWTRGRGQERVARVLGLVGFGLVGALAVVLATG